MEMLLYDISEVVCAISYRGNSHLFIIFGKYANKLLLL